MNGFINVFKTPGLTSSDVVVRLRRILNQKKIGHAGTLDPAAAGVLPIMLGKATRLFGYLQVGEKEYIAEFRFGIGTDTLDAEGGITQRIDKNIDATAIKEHLCKYQGDIEQIPPKVSAININGQRAYALARKGETVEIPSRQVTVHAFEMIRQTDENGFLFKIVCSKGTYIRSLCRDLANDLGTVAYMPYLLRMKSGCFRLDGAITLETIASLVEQDEIAKSIIDMDQPIAQMRRFDVKDSLFERVINGNVIRIDKSIRLGEYRVYCRDQFMGIGSVKKDKEGQKLKVDKMLMERK